MVRILIIGYVWPEPCSSAAGGRMLGLIETFLAEEWAVVFATPAQASLHQVDLGERGVDCRAITLNCDSFDRFLAEVQPDLVLFDRFMMEEQFGWRVARVCPDALRVLNTEDLHSLRQTRQRRLQLLLQEHKSGACGHLAEDQAIAGYFNATSPTLFQWMSTEELAHREIAAIQRCDLSLIISECEQSLLIEQFGVAPELLHYCPFMGSAVPAALPPFASRRHFLSIGNFRHGPNWDAVLWLKQRLWPAIRRQLPEVELHIYGAYPPPKATALDNAREGFRVKGWAEDAQAVLAGARVCLAPLRFGAGIKGKLADAMAAGTPSVTTPIGAEAMAARQGTTASADAAGHPGQLPWPGAVASTPDELVRAAVELYTNPAIWARAQIAGQSLINARFQYSVHGPALAARLMQARDQLAACRQRNFTGAMLRHHSHQSSHYMGQWIESKNRLQQLGKS